MPVTPAPCPFWRKKMPDSTQRHVRLARPPRPGAPGIVEVWQGGECTTYYITGPFRDSESGGVAYDLLKWAKSLRWDGDECGYRVTLAPKPACGWPLLPSPPELQAHRCPESPRGPRHPEGRVMSPGSRPKRWEIGSGAPPTSGQYKEKRSQVGDPGAFGGAMGVSDWGDGRKAKGDSGEGRFGRWATDDAGELGGAMGDGSPGDTAGELCWARATMKGARGMPQRRWALQFAPSMTSSAPSPSGR
jgi:hypothetical protein